jgi:hypothetical protein
MADFAELKQRITMLQACEMLGIALKKEKETYRAPCPICQKGDNRTLQVFPLTNTYYCWSEKKSGDIIGLVARYGKIDEAGAGRKLADHFDIKTQRKPETSGKFDPVEWGKSLDPLHAALTPFGISPETLASFGAGYNASRPSLKGMLCLPVRDASGTPTGFIGIHPETRELTIPKTITAQLLNIDRIGAGVLHVVTQPLDVSTTSRAASTNCKTPSPFSSPSLPTYWRASRLSLGNAK